MLNAMQRKRSVWWSGMAVAGALAATMGGGADISLVSPANAQVSDDGSFDSAQRQLAQTEAALREENARFERQVRPMKKDSRAYKDAAATHEQRVRQLRQQQNTLHDRVQRYGNRNLGAERTGDKLEGVQNRIQNEKQRYADRQANLPSGSQAAADEKARHEERLADLRGRRDDIREDRQENKGIRQADRTLNQDQRQLDNEIAAENARHNKALKFLPANSEAAQEEDREHAKRLREIEVRRSAVVGNRDLRIGGAAANRQFDDRLDVTDSQIRQEEARHAKRVKEVNRGSVAAAEEERQYAQNIGALRARRDDLSGSRDAIRGSTERVVYLRQQIKSCDDQAGAENARHQRLLNQLDAGSPGEAAERDRHAQALARINADRTAAANDLAALQGGYSSGR